MNRLRHPLSLLIIAVLVMLGVLRSYSPPEPRPADAPEVEFSAGRAYAILSGLLEEGVPHVTGSEENRRVRDRVLGFFADFGYQPEVQSRFHCNPVFGACSQVDNVIAIKPGTDGRSAVLLTAHYDGSWTGPGAADDGSGVAAILEIARMAAAYPPFRNDVIFLITDSEENGLIGADAFARHHPMFKKVSMVINLEARGVTGPSAMFETGEGNRRAIRVMADALDRPVANSLTYEVYKRMPNDTDYSVYKANGVMGLNFAFASGVAAYHSVVDNLANLDRGSLQHHGDNAWALVNALGDRELKRVLAREDAGYIDVFAMYLVHYPESIAIGLTLVLGVLTLIMLGFALRNAFRFRELPLALVALVFALLVFVLAAYLVSFPLGRWIELHPIEHPYPWYGRAVLVLALVMSLYATARLFQSRVSAATMMLLCWGVFVVLAMVLANALPTASHLMLIPLLAFVVGALLDVFRRSAAFPLVFASVLGFAGACFIAFYHFFMLDVVLNFDRSHVKALPLALLLVATLPLVWVNVLGRRVTWRPVWAALAVLPVFATLHVMSPAYTAERPRGMNIVYHESERAVLVLESPYGDADTAFAADEGFERSPIDTGRDEPSERWVRPAESLGLPGVRISMQSYQRGENGASRRFSLEVPDGLMMLQVLVPLEAALQRASVNGEPALDTSLPTKYRRTIDRLRIVNPAPGTLTFELHTGSDGPLSMAVVSWTDLPEGLARAHREAWPSDAYALFYPPRAEKVQRFELTAEGVGDG